METIIDSSEEKSLDFWNPHQEQEDAFYDNMSEEEFLQQLIMEEHRRMQNEYSIMKECVYPTLSQGLESVWLLLLACLILRFLGVLRIKLKLLHLASSVTGIIVLAHTYGKSSGYVVILCLIGCVCLYTLNSKLGNGACMALLCVAFLLSCEKYLVKEMEWNRIRGSVMVVSMKLIYIGFEKQKLTSDGFDVFAYFGYLLNPASIIFGPFITYKDYLQVSLAHSMTISWAFHVLKTLIFSAACLLWSTCGNSFILPKLGNSRWLDAYRDANGFRFSTYFVSYTSEAACLMMGIGTLFSAPNMNEMPQGIQDAPQKIRDSENYEGSNFTASNDKRNKFVHEPEVLEEMKEKVCWSRPVSKLLHVEIPRSLVEVVTNWNLPMHYWLKNYIFKTSRHLGVFPAILLTYLASSLLHGLNFQLSVILLSIGLFAYIENGARKTLASTFNACIEARRCRLPCHHRHKKWNFWVICTNLGFGFMAVWNLAYLGCLFDNDPDIQEQGYSMSHALRKWSALGYICHYVMFGVLLITKLINDGKLFDLPKCSIASLGLKRNIKIS